MWTFTRGYDPCSFFAFSHVCSQELEINRKLCKNLSDIRFRSLLSSFDIAHTWLKDLCLSKDMGLSENKVIAPKSQSLWSLFRQTHHVWPRQSKFIQIFEPNRNMRKILPFKKDVFGWLVCIVSLCLCRIYIIIVIIIAITIMCIYIYTYYTFAILHSISI